MFVDWFVDLSGKGKDATTKGTRTLVILVTWSIWCERNARIFDCQEKPIRKLVDEIKDTVRLWGSAGAKHLAALVATNDRE
ncbi:hypothetical protein HU200_024086 [Digitaria exilis]|uniref:Uncharacterized protein n=1 Tax=Digitaria exilis TaxID=1010633 RepID=A0A835DXB6_9POAL|nr:hypothetical protein HU200_066099 [Digitaria exilis]KAF8719378.1 hypothetical protein HU200_024086 [Digitaria exilis]